MVLPQKNLGGKVRMVLRTSCHRRIQFQIVGIPAIGHVVQFVCQEGIDDVSVKVQLLSKHPDVEKPVVPSVLCILSNNPRASEICNHLGSSASLFCRVCMINSATGLDNIAEYRTKAQTLQHIQSIQQCLTETEKKHIRNFYGITEVDNSLLELDLDLHRHRKKPKLHLLMHLPEYIELFRHPSSYKTERCETSNSLIRSQNV
eukprot:Em0017g432a